MRRGRKGRAERAPFGSCRGAKSVGFLPNRHLVTAFTLQKHVHSFYEYSEELETASSEVLMPTHKSFFFSVSPLGFKEQINIKKYKGTVFPDRLTATDALTS